MALCRICFQKIQSALQVHIFSGRPPQFLEECSPLIAHKHIVRLDRTGISQRQGQSAENPDIIAQSPNLEYVYQALKEAVYRPRIKQWTEITVTLGTELDNAVQGAKSVDDALKDAQTACEQIMKN